MPVVFMFPGQSSRYPDFFQKLESLGEYARSIIDEASDVLSFDLRRHFQPDNRDAFALNRNVQIGIFVANEVHAAVLRSHGVKSCMSLGLSLGEYNHLVDVEALQFREALQLVAARGQIYDRGPAGIMASVGPISFDELAEVVERASSAGIVEVTNQNSPTQHVIGGTSAAVEAALAILEDEFFVQGILIEQRIPMHCSLFRGVASEFECVLNSVSWKSPSKFYIPNSTAVPIQNATSIKLVDSLIAHVHSPVLWRQSVEAVLALEPDAIFVETGPRGVLYNLMQSKWVANRRFKTDSVRSDLASFEALAANILDLTDAR